VSTLSRRGWDILKWLAPSSASADLFAQISLAEMPAPAGRVVLVSSVIDRLVPPYAAHDYERALLRRRTAGVERVEIPDAGHFDPMTPGTRTWGEVMSRISASLQPPP
jgi:pimeloyl-ACP methyl ester carboxylesterase